MEESIKHAFIRLVKEVHPNSKIAAWWECVQEKYNQKNIYHRIDNIFMNKLNAATDRLVSMYATIEHGRVNQLELFERKELVKIISHCFENNNISFGPCTRDNFPPASLNYYDQCGCDMLQRLDMTNVYVKDTLFCRFTKSYVWIVDRILYNELCIIHRTQHLLTMENRDSIDTKDRPDYYLYNDTYPPVNRSDLLQYLNSQLMERQHDPNDKPKKLSVQQNDVSEPKTLPKCSICLDNYIDSFVMPCGHACACYTCFNTNAKYYTTCPVCRRLVDKISLLYI
ncbi:Hypothetical predicted protein [Mytilus galloprovincialis]|uniref:RING-type domain-containing protein n=1 Tax=Mytilus galloprovincialis TaxID=29158 RepID=A0A8B6E014_MYTGA|nr:Hypothetical predicted protein [Mytilus galloprovincialis]